MKFISHYSSSKHNLYTVESVSGQRLMIECGCTPKQLQKKLDYKLDNICGCLISHGHADHSKAVEFVLEAGIDCFMSKGTMNELALIHRRIFLLEDRHPVKINEDFEVFPFDVQHDAAEPLGFIIRDGDKRKAETLLFVTDTSHIKQKFGEAFNIIAICCNYDVVALGKHVESGKVNETYAKRLLTSHMERRITKAYIHDFCNLSKCTEIHLLHMSENNADKRKIRKEFEDEFFIKTYIAGESP